MIMTITLLAHSLLVFVTEQHCVSIFFTRLGLGQFSSLVTRSVRKPLLFDTQIPAHAYKYKTKRQAKMKRDSRKMTFLVD